MIVRDWACKQTRWQDRQRAAGRCPRCGDPAAEGYITCRYHVLLARERYRRRL